MAGEDLAYAVERLIQSAQAGTSHDEIWSRIRSIISESEISADLLFAPRRVEAHPSVSQSLSASPTS